LPCNCDSAQTADEFEDPIFKAGKQWALEAISIGDAWPHISMQDTPVIAGVLDSGVATDHSDFFDAPEVQSNIWRNADESANGRDDPDGNGNGYIDDLHGHAFVPISCRNPAAAQSGCHPSDLNGHGTKVAAIIGAQANNGRGIVGVHYRAEIMALRWEADDGGPDYAGIASAIDYAHDQGAKVLNISLYVPTGDSQGDVARVIGEAQDDMLIVYAAGNRRRNLCGRLPNDVFLMNKQPNMMIVMAAQRYSHSATNVAKESHSNFGNCLVDIAAPGECICTPRWGSDDYEIWGQTSAAAPHVSGAAAILMSMSEFQKCSPTQIREILVVNAMKLTGGTASNNRATGTLDLAFLGQIGGNQDWESPCP
jgi:subtilisin family serine protease